jgi:hypothetical protein
LKGVVPRLEVFPFTRIKASSVKQAYVRGVFKMASKSICTSTDAASPNPLSPIPSASSAMKTQKTHEGPDNPESADEGNIQMEYPSD